MKKILTIILAGVCMLSLLNHRIIFADTTSLKGPGDLYAISAVLLDGDSGRVLYEKNGSEVRPMASTTKIMTCILALETADITQIVTVSKRAVRQPKVHLGMYEGEQFVLKDLLYSLMLESHNDSAVAVAEAVGGSVEDFAALMNKKAKEIGCEDTFFITPNGLDDSLETDSGQKVHATTATDLARIMRYCVFQSEKKGDFLAITRCQTYSFQDKKGLYHYACYNHNAFLQMMDGALSGKTGFTNDAGYCYVGALERDGKKFIVALLGCGWPNNKSYKWADTKKLLNYGLEAYEYRTIGEDSYTFPKVKVTNGRKKTAALATTAGKKRMLLRKDETAEIKISCVRQWDAPIKKRQKAGVISYQVNGKVVASYDVYFKEDISCLTWKDYWKIVWGAYAF